MSWRPLCSSSSADSKLPTLLYSAAFGSDSYTVHLTDLTQIWSERLSRRDIFQRSKDENTSIDPGDGDQLRVLLDKIRIGIEGGDSSTLILIVNDDDGIPSITLSITVALPGGLHPLGWPVHLAPAPQSLLTEHFIIPLLEAQQARIREISSLTDIIREKDHVVQKLVDKLESQGTQLGQVFPQAAGKSSRKSDRKVIEEKIRGLKVFDIEAFRQGAKTDEPLDFERLASEVFRNDGHPHINVKSTFHILKDPENWWENIKGDSFGIHSSKYNLSGQSKVGRDNKSARQVAMEEESFYDDNEDFQVQATPPHLALPKQKSGKQHSVDDSTDDDDGLDAPSQPSKVPDSLPPSQLPQRSPVKVTKKLGVVGGKRDPSKLVLEDDDETTDGSTPSPIRRSPSREEGHKPPIPELSLSKPKRTLGTIGGKKAPAEPEKTLLVKEQVKPSRGRLGQIGGKKKEDKATTSLPEIDSVVSHPKLTTDTTKIGALEGPKSKFGVEEKGKASEGHRGRAVKQEPENMPPPRETSEERANKKREKLKMELEEKAKAPAKKKRKF
ncbi:hypothetical protein OIDMADRAFT_31796 [Oidiodendron maius Zn]|uniref:Non-homologous end-joining factor 1 n=1 Tax=Oidiodendron maius (strain Zn) TaxID=913774 RepID=A0A0C3D7J4_OIDMZ|nr:hypothetical protein OIDMADRAFT_31796 [Oidiodendron maius Zn]